MLMNTHKILADNILKRASKENEYLIDRKKFMWGNIKPDYVSKYKLKKHYYNESIDMILCKIKFLSSLSENEVLYVYGKKKFSAELGVVCHFLCDYFCLAHNRRWRFKDNFKRHVSYEKRLAKYAKDFNFKSSVCSFLEINNIKKFIDDNIKSYEENIELRNDLDYASFVCSSIVGAVLSQIEKNNLQERKIS
ncbi:Zinc dependent phospholipase C [Clostridium sp. DSM 8431]|nr:Zinc dependent phospholipase C [Clostridium sp. DSM 8431]